MTNQEILTKAIEKAIDGGWIFFEDCTLLPTKDWIIPNSFTVWNSYLNDKVHIPQQCVIFNHGFAKALWGAGQQQGLKHYSIEKDVVLPLKRWEYYLQQMVIADDPIQYLGENI